MQQRIVRWLVAAGLLVALAISQIMGGSRTPVAYGEGPTPTPTQGQTNSSEPGGHGGGGGG